MRLISQIIYLKGHLEETSYVLFDHIKDVQFIESAKKMVKDIHQNGLLSFTCLPYELFFDALVDTQAPWLSFVQIF